MLHEHFPPPTPDREWLLEVGRRGWVVLTKDQRIHRRRIELDALLSAGVAAFVLTSGNMSGTATANAFVLAYPRIRKTLRDFAPPLVAAVHANGRLRMLTPTERLAARRRIR